ncbi:UDP-glucose dehydrogenase family protein [Chloroflexota bacterium]
MMLVDKRVSIVGIWHLGAVVSACLADLGYLVVGVDKNMERINRLNKGIPPLIEPGLEEMLINNLKSKRLSYTIDLEKAMRGCKYVLITFDTPVNDKDEIDLSEIHAASTELIKYLENGSIIIVSSQVPVGTCEQIKTSMKQLNPSLDFDIVYSPENLQLGQAVEQYKHPERIVIGADNDDALDRTEEFFNVIRAPKVRMNLQTAEMTKHVLNAFLATSISFANEIGNLCDEIGVDAIKVAQALGSDARIGPKLPLKPGLAFSGGTLARELKVLQSLGDKLSYETWLIDGVLKVNEQQNKLVLKKLENIYGSVKNLTVGVLGLVYKAGTSTLRRSAALEIIEQLTHEGALVKAYDPKADPEEIQSHREFESCNNSYQVAKNSDALVIMTDWLEFTHLDFNLIKSIMKKPVIIDTRNMLDREQLVAEGFLYSGIGTGTDYGIRK